MRNILALVPLGVVALAGVLAIPAEPAEPAIALQIKAEQDIVPSGSPSRVDITIKNVSSQPVGVRRERAEGSGEISQEFDVRDSSGDPVPETRWGRRVREGPPIISSSILSIVAPGETAKDEVVLNRVYDLSLAGQYTVQAKRFDEVSKIWVKSNTITITIQ
jgi:hypothetical protein